MAKKVQEVGPFVCGLDATLRVISGKWKPLILYFLSVETKRYGELKHCVKGVSNKMLIQHLKEMESDGIVSRVEFQEIPPRVEYSLTAFGISLAKSMMPLCEWGNENAPKIASALAKRKKPKA